MNAIATPPTPDSAAVFAAAKSLWEACKEAELADADICLSDAYHGYDQLMREVMRIAEEFEAWACDHVAFEEMDEVWPYLLGGHFGENCTRLLGATELGGFGDRDCLRVALAMRLPLKSNGSLPIPVDLRVPNPQAGSTFTSFRIQTVRIRDDEAVSPGIARRELLCLHRHEGDGGHRGNPG